ncbi:hypothetical protein ABES02_29770 [Neobacillus pocheonensis]|uniref:hypothetical protein n=1 Tax=Neobacillus pocheonensis TaxID=363869 RepID=UPI003D2D0D49
MMRDWTNTAWVEHFDALPGEPIKTLVNEDDGHILAQVVEARSGKGYVLQTKDIDGFEISYLYPELTRLLHVTHLKFGLPSNLVPFTNVIDGVDYIVELESRFTYFALFTKEHDNIRITFSITPGVLADDYEYAIIEFSTDIGDPVNETLGEVCKSVEGLFHDYIFDGIEFEGIQFTCI